VQQYPDQGVRYILLAIESEVLSEQAGSPYLREAYLRLSRFWLASAAAAQGKESERFRAPTRANMYAKVESLCPLDNIGEDIGGAPACVFVDVEMRDGAEFPLPKH
jgi:hypothetical protein